MKETMKWNYLLVAVLTTVGTSAQAATNRELAFVHSSYARNRVQDACRPLHASTEAECGCASDVVFSGEPSLKAKGLDLREAIRRDSVFDLNGNSVNFDDLIGEPGTKTGESVAVAVFLRSLG